MIENKKNTDWVTRDRMSTERNPFLSLVTQSVHQNFEISLKKPEILEKFFQLSEKYSHNFDENFGNKKFRWFWLFSDVKFTKSHFSISSSNWSRRFSIFPPILNFQITIKIFEFFNKKICKFRNSRFLENSYHCICQKTYFFLLNRCLRLISRFSFFYSALFFCRWLSLFWEDNG